MHLHKPLTLALQEGREVDDYEKAGAIKRMDNERDSLCAFHLRIATFDSGWANAAAEQDALHRKEGERCPPYKNYRLRYPLS